MTDLPELPELEDTVPVLKPCKMCDKSVEGEDNYLLYMLMPGHNAGAEDGDDNQYYWHNACYIADPWIEIDYVDLQDEHYRYMRPVSTIKIILDELSANRPGFMVEPYRLRYFNNQMLKTVTIWRTDLLGKEVKEI